MDDVTCYMNEKGRPGGSPALKEDLLKSIGEVAIKVHKSRSKNFVFLLKSGYGSTVSAP